MSNKATKVNICVFQHNVCGKAQALR